MRYLARLLLVLPVLPALACVDGGDSSEPAMDTREQSAIYGADDRTDVYAHPDERLREIARQSIVALMSPEALDMRDPAHVRISARTLGTNYDLCSDQRFRDQPAAASCSGTLIADDLVLTAGHCATSLRECQRLRFVFNYYYEADGRLATITEEDIFTCRALVAQSGGGWGDDDDYAVIQLDRSAAPRHRPADVRRDATPLSTNDPVTIIGFGSGIPAKIDSGGHVIDPNRSSVDVFTATTDSFGGNSGSGVFDGDDRVVGILIAGANDYVDRGGCTVVATYPEDGGDEGETVTYFRLAREATCNDGWDSPICGDDAGCGDGLCVVGEDFGSCPSDCHEASPCGDGICASDESHTSCSEDCPPPPGCPNGICEPGEWATTCPDDCAPQCGNGICEPGEWDVCADCAGDSCGNGACDEGEPETCPDDCPTDLCGNGECDDGEWRDCPDDCPTDLCGNGECDDGEWRDCPDDCPTDLCGNGVCDGGEWRTCREDCESTAPDDWFCDREFWGSLDGCDCDCGPRDPDCDIASQEIFNCEPGQICDEVGACVDEADIDLPPDAWECEPDRWADGATCDCDCGALDPDCRDAGAPIHGCEPGQVCDSEGLCTNGVPNDRPAGWECLPEFYAAGDGCDCDCGSWDPDCADPSQTVYNCAPGASCSPSGLCVPPIPAPTDGSGAGPFVIEPGEDDVLGGEGLPDMCAVAPGRSAGTRTSWLLLSLFAALLARPRSRTRR